MEVEAWRDGARGREEGEVPMASRGRSLDWDHNSRMPAPAKLVEQSVTDTFM